MVVDFAIHGQSDRLIRAQNWLGAAVRINYGETLVNENAIIVHEYATPVRTAMSDSLRQIQRGLTESSYIFS